MSRFVPLLEGTTSDPGGGSPPGSGNKNIPTGTAPTLNLANLPTTGGLLGTQSLLLIPGQDQDSGLLLFYKLDPTNFNCEEDVVYDFKVEEMEIGNKTTIHNVLVRYRDIGIVTFTIGIINFTSEVFNSKNSKTVTIGSKKPTNKIFTKKMDIPPVTIEAPFIRILRKANAGPLAITKVKAWGTYGDGDII